MTSSAALHQFSRALLILLAIGCLGTLGTTNTAAQEADHLSGAHNYAADPKASGPQSASANAAQQDSAALVVAPLPILSPALGSGIVPVLAYIFPLRSNDKTSPPSLVGAVGLIYR